jgi:hypothetical protein
VIQSRLAADGKYVREPYLAVRPASLSLAYGTDTSRAAPDDLTGPSLAARQRLINAVP